MKEIIESAMAKLMETMNEIQFNYISNYYSTPPVEFYMDLGLCFFMTCIKNTILDNHLVSHSEKKQAIDKVVKGVKNIIEEEFNKINGD